MIYKIVAFAIEVAVRQFFQQLTVIGKSPVLSSPVIVAANHPNQAVDPFLIGTIYPRSMWYLAKSTLFTNRFLAFLFRAMHMVPVYRPQDKADLSLNNDMFRDVIAKLHSNEGIVIFPEGTSTEERRLLPLKTGVARIALQAEADKNWNANILIQPVGITYLSPRVFQSSATVELGEPIVVNTYRLAYEENRHNAVKELTAEVEQSLLKVTVSLPSLELQQDVEHIAQLFDDQPDLRERMQLIADRASKIAKTHPAQTQEIRQEIERLSKEGFTLGFFGIGSQRMISQNLSNFRFANVLIGRFLHFIPYYATQIAVDILVKDPHNLASVKIGFGLLFYTLWYLMIFCLCLSMGLTVVVSSALVILIMIIGDRTNRYTDGAQLYLRNLVSRICMKGDSKDGYHQRVESFLKDRSVLRDKLIAISEANQ